MYIYTYHSLSLSGTRRVVALKRAEGEATVHSSELMHAVARVGSGGARYSLIIFCGLAPTKQQAFKSNHFNQNH